MKPDAATDPPLRGLRLVFRALQYRNYRLFVAGQGISLIGTWMQRIALSWLVYRLTNSAALLGVVGFAGQIPGFVLAPFAGVLVDRWDLRRMLVVTQALSMLQALTLALLLLGNVLTPTNAVWPILLLSALLGIINAFDMPARQSLVVHMVEKREDLSNAIALNSAMFNAARLLGPSVAGVLVAAMGEGMCFLANGLSYIAVIAALLAMKLSTDDGPRPRGNVWHELTEGFRYSFGFAPIRSILLLLSVVSLVGMPYQVLMPVFARDVLHGGPQVQGFLMAAAGIGALIGAALLASRQSVLGLERWIAFAPAAFGLGLIAFSQSRLVWLSLALMLVTGVSMMTQMTSSNTVVQTLVDDSRRGRVMAFYAMAFMGTAPFGNLMAGGLAAHVGAPNTLLIGGLACLLGSALFAARLPALRRSMQPIYERLGIVGESPATGDEDSARPDLI